MVKPRESVLARGSSSGSECQCEGQWIKTSASDFVYKWMKRSLTHACISLVVPIFPLFCTPCQHWYYSEDCTQQSQTLFPAPFTYIPDGCLGPKCVFTFSTWCGYIICMDQNLSENFCGWTEELGDGLGRGPLSASCSGEGIWRWLWKDETLCQRIFVWLEWRKGKGNQHRRKAGRRPWSHQRKPLRKKLGF